MMVRLMNRLQWLANMMPWFFNFKVNPVRLPHETTALRKPKVIFFFSSIQTFWFNRIRLLDALGGDWTAKLVPTTSGVRER